SCKTYQKVFNASYFYLKSHANQIDSKAMETRKNNKLVFATTSLVKKREGLGDSSPRVLLLTLARSFQEAFFCDKCAARRLRGSRFLFFGNDSRTLYAALRKTTHPKMGAI
ncbi:MAG: hypothetical protein H7834_16105, partial [Magnetococcus sp. YQC-9]